MVKKVMKKVTYDIEKSNSSLQQFFCEQKKINSGFPIKMSPIVTSNCTSGYRNKCEFTIGKQLKSVIAKCNLTFSEPGDYKENNKWPNTFVIIV